MSSSQTPRPSIILKDKNRKRVVGEYPPIITQRRPQFSQQSHQKNQYNNDIDSISRISANTQQRDRVLNHQVYQSNNHIDRSPAVTNNDSLTNCGPSNKENLPPNSSGDDFEDLVSRCRERHASLQQREALLQQRLA